MELKSEQTVGVYKHSFSKDELTHYYLRVSVSNFLINNGVIKNKKGEFTIYDEYGDSYTLHFDKSERLKCHNWFSNQNNLNVGDIILILAINKSAFFIVGK